MREREREIERKCVGVCVHVSLHVRNCVFEEFGFACEKEIERGVCVCVCVCVHACITNEFLSLLCLIDD